MHSPRRVHSRKSPDAPHIGDQLIANIPVPENCDQSEKASSVKSPLCWGSEGKNRHWPLGHSAQHKLSSLMLRSIEASQMYALTLMKIYNAERCGAFGIWGLSIETYARHNPT